MLPALEAMMALQFNDTLRNALLDQIETTIGTSAILRIYSGTAPADESTALSGNTKLVDATLPADWMANASAGVKGLSGTWSDSSADATGTATFFRIYKSDGTTCVIQGTVGASGADLNLTTTSIVAGQPVTITQFDLTAPG